MTSRDCSYDDGRRRFQQDAFHTFEAPARFSDICRVCLVAVKADELVRKRTNFLEVAHAACGWLKMTEHAPHEVRRPGTSLVFYEWRCPTCGLDACHTRKPLAGDDLQCKRCRPRKLEAGAVAEVIMLTRAPRWNPKSGRYGQVVEHLHVGARVVVRELVGGMAVVAPLAWSKGRVTKITTMALSAV